MSFILLAALFIGACSQPSPVPNETDTYFYGRISSGEKFGVLIGHGNDVASGVLTEKKYRDDGMYTCSTSLKKITGCIERDVYHIFRVIKPLKDGSIYLEIDSGKVTEIAWDFDLIETAF